MIKFKDGYKYQLADSHWSVVSHYLPEVKSHAWITVESNASLRGSSVIRVNNHYAWDGPSGPTIDTDNFMRGSLIHDALYQLMREGVINEKYRKTADLALRELCIQDGMSKLRAWWVYQGVRLGGKKSATKGNVKPTRVI